MLYIAKLFNIFFVDETEPRKFVPDLFPRARVNSVPNCFLRNPFPRSFHATRDRFVVLCAICYFWRFSRVSRERRFPADPYRSLFPCLPMSTKRSQRSLHRRSDDNFFKCSLGRPEIGRRSFQHVFDERVKSPTGRGVRYRDRTSVKHVWFVIDGGQAEFEEHVEKHVKNKSTVPGRKSHARKSLRRPRDFRPFEMNCGPVFVVIFTIHVVQIGGRAH